MRPTGPRRLLSGTAALAWGRVHLRHIGPALRGRRIGGKATPPTPPAAGHWGDSTQRTLTPRPGGPGPGPGGQALSQLRALRPGPGSGPFFSAEVEGHETRERKRSRASRLNG